MRPRGAFLQAVLGLTTSQQEADFAAFQLPEGGTFKVFGPGRPGPRALLHQFRGRLPGRRSRRRGAGAGGSRGGAPGRAGGRAPRRMAPFRAEPGAANRPVSAISWVPVRIDPSHGLADGLTCGRVPPPPLGVLAAAGKIRRIRGMSGGIRRRRTRHNPGPVPCRPGAGHPGASTVAQTGPPSARRNSPAALGVTSAKTTNPAPRPTANTSQTPGPRPPRRVRPILTCALPGPA
jgi:hypothetical protein